MAARTILVLSSIVAMAIAAPPAFAINSDSSPQQGSGSSAGDSTQPAKPHHHKHAHKPHPQQPGGASQGTVQNPG
jgi:hypothetical protein